MNLRIGTASVLVLASMAWGGAAHAEEPSVLSDIDEDGAYDVEGTFEVDATSATGWAVLADYEHIGDFVSSMRRSLVLERRPGGLLLEQEAVGKAFFLSRRMRVRLEVREEHCRRIVFKDVSGLDFESYSGSWTLDEWPSGLRVIYRLHAKPRFAPPRFLGRRVFESNAARLLEEVRDEILRRSAADNAGVGQAVAKS